MKKVTLLMGLLSLLVVGCSTAKVRRHRGNDSLLRIILDPTIPVNHYVQIRRALVESGKFEVIDRRDGFAAAVREQDIQFRSGYQNRFSDQEKWAHIGKMYGARGIITAHAQCYQKKHALWGDLRRYCKQDLTFIDGVTGKVEFAVTGENNEVWTAEWTVPDWDDVVEKAVATYPEYFKAREIEPMLQQYMDQSEEHSKRERASQDLEARPSRQIAKDLGRMQRAAQEFEAQNKKQYNQDEE